LEALSSRVEARLDVLPRGLGSSPGGPMIHVARRSTLP
jgi:hypothetical protein